MSYTVSQGDIFGRVGSGIGQGLAEQLPKEISRNRLSEGLKAFEQESANLTPTQQLARLASIPGALEHPQLIQSFGNLARQQAQANALRNYESDQNKPGPSTFPKSVNENVKPAGSNIPSITQETPLAKAQEGYIPPTREEIDQEAGKAFNANPAFFGNDPQKAIDWAEDKALRERGINEAYQKKHENLTRLQDNLVKRLNDHVNRLGVNKVPANTYSLIEDKAIQATKPKDQGGDGLTEQQAMKKFGGELDEINRDYEAVDTIGNWGITLRPAKETLNNLKSLQEKFDKRNDTENFADTMISKNQLSPKVAYSIAKPVSKVKGLSNEISNLKPIKGQISASGGMLGTQFPKKADVEAKTLEASKNLSRFLKGNEKASPLAIAYELEKRGYDPSVWLDYVVRNRKDLSLTEAQGREIDKPNNLIGTWNDWWLSSWSGIEQ